MLIRSIKDFMIDNTTNYIRKVVLDKIGKDGVKTKRDTNTIWYLQNGVRGR